MQKVPQSTEIATEYGVFRLWVWPGPRGGEPVALTTPEIDPTREICLRIHSECLSGDVFGAYTCDCGAQKARALRRIAAHGNGVFVYHRQEGRNAGLYDKVRAYELMRSGLDTHEALLALTGSPDPRTFDAVLPVLREVLRGMHPLLRLLSMNAYKRLFLERHGYRAELEPLAVERTSHDEAYARTKAEKFLHTLEDTRPYVGVEVSLADLAEQGSALATLLARVAPQYAARKIFVGLSLELHELCDVVIGEKVAIFRDKVRNVPGVYIVFHLSYPRTAREREAVRQFVRAYSAPCALQFRALPVEGKFARIDMHCIDSLSVEHVVFQMRREEMPLLSDAGFVRAANRSGRSVLLDDSGGRGRVQTRAKRCSQVLACTRLGWARIGVAGGLGKGAAEEVFAVEDYCKIPVSADAHTRLRTRGRVDLSRVEAYLTGFLGQGPSRGWGGV
jgi:GTP cyclohydrolase II